MDLDGKSTERVGGRVTLGGVFRFRCYGPDGELKWEDVAENLVVNEGLNHILDILFLSATTQIDPWYIGLTDSAPTVAAGDTMGSHAGWVEDQNYDEAARQEFIESRTSQTVDNSASVAAFSINATTTIGGAFLTSDNTKGGTTGTLLAVAAFSGGDKSADNGDTLEVTYDFSAADDGV